MSKTNTKEFYQKLLKKIKEEMDEKDFMDEVFFGDNPPKFDVDGVTVVFEKENIVLENEIVMEGPDMRAATSAVVATPGDEFVIYQEGEYDSWEGIQFEEELLVGKILERTVVIRDVVPA